MITATQVAQSFTPGLLLISVDSDNFPNWNFSQEKGSFNQNISTMKKITLSIGLFLLGLSAVAQQSEQSNSLQTKERDAQYIIVLDDTEVDSNIDILLSGSEVSHKKDIDFVGHELIHSNVESNDIQEKFIQTAYSYNEIAMAQPALETK